MTLALKPGWNAATITLTGFALLIEWPLALGVAAYAMWGDRLTGAARHDTRPLASAGNWFTGREIQPAGTSDTAAEAWRATEIVRVDAELAAHTDAQAAARRSEEQAQVEKFMANRALVQNS